LKAVVAICCLEAEGKYKEAFEEDFCHEVLEEDNLITQLIKDVVNGK
jgi:hypothetical protein